MYKKIHVEGMHFMHFDTPKKGLFTQKWEFAEFAEKVIQDVHEFVSSLEQIWRNAALRHLLTNGSSIRMRVQTADKNSNPQVIHMTAVHKWMACEEKNCVCKKTIHH